MIHIFIVLSWKKWKKKELEEPFEKTAGRDAIEKLAGGPRVYVFGGWSKYTPHSALW